MFVLSSLLVVVNWLSHIAEVFGKQALGNPLSFLYRLAYSFDFARETEAARIEIDIIRTNRAMPNAIKGILKAGSEWRTAVVGMPAKYAAKKMMTNAPPTPSRTNKSVVRFLSPMVNFFATSQV